MNAHLMQALDAALKATPVQAASGNGVTTIWGTSPESIDRAEDRDRWMELLAKLDIRQPAGSRCGVRFFVTCLCVCVRACV
jgi:carbamoyl-phosphate synthase large subunit